MFCQNCGQRIRIGTLFCTGCGFRLAYAHTAAAVALPKPIQEFSGFKSTIDDDPLKRPFLVSLFAIMYIASAVVAFLNGFFTFASGVYAMVNEGVRVEALVVVGLGLLFLSLGGLWWFTGTGLWNLKPNARIIHMILSALSILSLFAIPIAILVFWYFTRPATKILFSGKTEFELTPHELEILTAGKKNNTIAAILGIVLIIVAIIGGLFAKTVTNSMMASVEKGKQKRTMADLQAIGMAVEAYAVDHGAYPEAYYMEELASKLEPKYIRQLPRKDGWDRELQYLGWSSKYNRKGAEFYRIASAGKDGIWEFGDIRIYDVKPTRSFESDIVFGRGMFIQFPEGIVR